MGRRMTSSHWRGWKDGELFKFVARWLLDNPGTVRGEIGGAPCTQMSTSVPWTTGGGDTAAMLLPRGGTKYDALCLSVLSIATLLPRA
jgi:hypothetical protein